MDLLSFGSFINGLGETNQMLFGLLVIWTMVWKGLALWKAAGEKKTVWFVVLLVINTFGVLDILYYFLFSKMQKKEIAPVEEEEKKGTETKE